MVILPSKLTEKFFMSDCLFTLKSKWKVNTGNHGNTSLPNLGSFSQICSQKIVMSHTCTSIEAGLNHYIGAFHPSIELGIKQLMD